MTNSNIEYLNAFISDNFIVYIPNSIYKLSFYNYNNSYIS